MTTETTGSAEPAPQTLAPAPGRSPENAYAFDDVTFGMQRASEVDAVLAEVLKLVDEPAEAPPATPPAPPAEAVAPATPPAETPPPAPAPTPEPEADRGMLRLLEREGQVRDRETALERRERELAAVQAKLEALAARGPDLSDYRTRIQSDPLKAVEEVFGMDPEQVSRLIITAKLGDKAPPQLREAAQQYGLRKELSEIKRDLASRDFQVAVEKVRTSAHEFAGSIKQGESTYPALAAVAAVDPKAVAEEVFLEIARDADARGVGPGGQLMSREEAAKRVEARWDLFRKAFTPAAPAPAPAAPPSPNAPPPPAKTAPQGSTATDTKTPPPPPRRSYWGSDRDAEVQAALDEALAIARRV